MKIQGCQIIKKELSKKLSMRTEKSAKKEKKAYRALLKNYNGPVYVMYLGACINCLCSL